MCKIFHGELTVVSMDLVFDTTVNSQFLKRHFDKLNQDVNGIANLILKS
jgi:hypothetical protein